MYSRILVAIDGSDTSRQALALAIELAGQLSAALRIVHVVDMNWLPLGPEFGIDVQAASGARRHAGETIIDASRATARESGIEAEADLLETGSPGQHVADTIAHEAARWHADLLVVGTHGHRGFERMFLGSVAENIARCDVSVGCSSVSDLGSWCCRDSNPHLRSTDEQP